MKLNTESTTIGFSETIVQDDVVEDSNNNLNDEDTATQGAFPEGFDPSQLNGQNLSPEMMSAIEQAQKEAEENGDKTIYCNVDDDGYLQCVYYLPAGGDKETTPWIKDFHGRFDLDGYRIMGHKYDPENHDLIWDQEHYDEVIAKLKVDAEQNAKNNEINRLKSQYVSSVQEAKVDVDDILSEFGI